GVVHGVRTFLPHIVASGGGHIVNTASIAGLFPGFAAPYDASKHAVVAMTESLFNSLQMSPVPVGVSCLCPGWVRTGILDADRNWPPELGARPEVDPISAISREYVRRAIDEGTQAESRRAKAAEAQAELVADLVLDAVRANRFWVFPNPDFLEIAVARFHTIGEGLDPSPPEHVPGMPPRSTMMAEVLEAVMATMAPTPAPEPDSDPPT
ncbi:MAG TPA: SDR family NAD(P)-dependent oxidoreductase, partial [Ilumatobacteraceae bacterium]|nr:SDR family NAD(P)-dependent oxidoreductase [Ilumatobacteraceae bacterium]